VLRAAKEAFKGLRPDVALGFTGACFALIWTHQPLALVLALGPTWLVYQGLTVPLLAHKARTDAKTGLANFEHFTQTFDEMLTSARRHGSKVGVVMLDMDHLREVNNEFGHLVGDRAIRAISETLADVTAAYGLAARFGGEEFCLLLPNTSASAAAQVAEDVRRRVEAVRFREDDEAAGLRITVSAGVSAFPQHGDDRDTLIEAADMAVYEAKAGGRNCVRVAPARAAGTAPAGYQPSTRVATA
jgi:diguanylate cyclase (GGDEF)-like protein